MNQYALQELPLKRLQHQREDYGGPHQLVECKSCGEQAVMVAWCYECDAMICQPCVTLHMKIAGLREHYVVGKLKESSTNKARSSESMSSKCSLHGDEKLKFFCVPCSELVCPECLLFEHKDHQFSLVEEARHGLETMMEDMASLAMTKKQEFGWYLEHAVKAEGKALEYSELMKSEVNNVFDGIVASVEAQRNEALQSVSQGVKEIWSQKEMMEVSLAQLDSFTRFADHASKCTTNTSYVAMAAQGVKLMEQLKNTHGVEDTLDQNMVSIVPLISMTPLHIPLNVAMLFVLGQLSLNFSPAPCSTIDCPSTGIEQICLTVSFITEGQAVISKLLRKKCIFHISADVEPYIYVASEPAVDESASVTVVVGSSSVPEPVLAEPTAEGSFDADGSVPLKLTSQDIAEEEFAIQDENAVECSAKLVKHSDELAWKITIGAPCLSCYQTLVVRYRLSGIIASETAEVTYKF